jgi:hypothetical protein
MKTDAELIGAVAGRIAAVDERAARDIVYDCTDSESLTHSDWRDAIEELLEQHTEVGSSVEEVLDRMFHSTTLSVFERSAPATPEYIRRVAHVAVVHAIDTWSEDYGPPDGYAKDWGPFTHAQFMASVAIVEGTLASLFATRPVWNCDQIGSVEITREEMAAIARDLRGPETTGG